MTLDICINRNFDAFQLNVSQAFVSNGITALFGPSGCGKSTLLRIIAGLETAAEGKVSYRGENWQSAGSLVPAWQRGIGFVFQKPQLFPHLTVQGNLSFAERRSKHIKSSITWEKVIAALDLAPLLNRQVAALSGGEKQRVAIGRSLLTRPSLMLMDEPLSALDMKRRAAILPLIRDLPRLFELPVIYVTHEIDEVAQIADRLALMQNGTIMVEGPVETLLENPELDDLTGRFEAGILIDATVAAHDQAFHLTSLVCEGHQLTLPLVPLELGDRVRLRIRARDVALATQRPQGLSIRNVLPATILTLNSENDSAFAEVVLAFGSAKLRSRITRASVAELGLKPGYEVFALVKSIAFDRSSLGARL